MRGRALLAAGVLVAATVTACGGGGDSTPLAAGSGSGVSTHHVREEPSATDPSQIVPVGIFALRPGRVVAVGFGIANPGSHDVRITSVRNGEGLAPLQPLPVRIERRNLDVTTDRSHTRRFTPFVLPAKGQRTLAAYYRMGSCRLLATGASVTVGAVTVGYDVDGEHRTQAVPLGTELRVTRLRARRRGQATSYPHRCA